jgi:metal-dependent amidase/aminoacylase/carboxypeptidase family protein
MVLRGALACVDATFSFYGKQAHASSAPEKGISALDAMINTFVAINSLRQFCKEDVRIHGIITKGGDAPNVVPDYCEAKFILRAGTVRELRELRSRKGSCMRSATTTMRLPDCSQTICRRWGLRSASRRKKAASALRISEMSAR